MNIGSSSLSLLTGRAVRALLGFACLAAPAAAQVLLSELKLAVPDPHSGFGSQLAGIGDVNADGHDDFLLSVPYGNYANYPGIVQLRSGADSSVLRTFTSPLWTSKFGTAMDSVGDIDGDGLQDVLVGAPDFGVDGSLSGRVQVFSSATGLVLLDLTGEPYDRFGQVVAGVGDLDGDGRGDFAAGAPYETDANGSVQNGYVRIISGGTGADLALLTGDFQGQGLGHRVRPAGDMNADGVPDVAVLVGLWVGEVGLRVYSGAWLVQRVGPQLLADIPAISIQGGVDRAGDIDGDGYDDLLLGRPYGPPSYKGSFIVMSGKDHSTLLHHLGSTPNQGLGSNVAGAGDLNHDGVPDLLASGPGAVPAVPGGAIAVSGKDGTVLGSLSEGALVYPGIFGSGLAGIGDVNADGSLDWAVSSPGESKVSLESQVGVWTDVGFGLAGALGIPQLSGSGLLLGGDPASLHLQGARPSSQVALVIGQYPVYLPFKGGVFVPVGQWILTELTTDALGDLTVAATWPDNLSLSETWFQVWQADSAGPLGYAASNALRAQAP